MKAKTFLIQHPRGSIKASVGHLEGASALASIAKCILILEKGVIAPNALFERWNSKINAKALMLQVSRARIVPICLNNFLIAVGPNYIHPMALHRLAPDIRQLVRLWRVKQPYYSGRCIPCVERIRIGR